jgi:hypothetical protein
MVEAAFRTNHHSLKIEAGLTLQVLKAEDWMWMPDCLPVVSINYIG